jgi:pimeloyl-ACP methyl ester carboxylesterase
MERSWGCAESPPQFVTREVVVPSLFQIVTNTPLWVWPLMATVVALGLYGLRPRTVPLVRLAILPLVGLGTSLAGILQSQQPVLSAAGWLLALLVFLPVGHAIGRRREVRGLPDGRLEIAGGWFMLLFGLSIFAARYALGVLFGVMPALKVLPPWIVISGAVGGVIAGIGLGWLSGLVARARGASDVAIKRWVRRGAGAIAAVLLLIVGGMGAVIAFDSPGTVPTLAAGNSLPGIASWNFAEVPPVSSVMARDGAPLTYRLYPGRPDRVVVLMHGSSGASISMHKSAQALQAAGATVYSISLRGHGGSGFVNGDTSYQGQLDDDLVDLTKALKLADTRAHRTLIGFSASGGLVLRTASGANRQLFDDYIAISPYIARESPTSRPSAGGWVSVAVPRVMALNLLDAFGLPWFQGLPIVRFATEAKPSDSRTPVYSYRLQTGMQLGRDWRARIASIDRPLVVVAGAEDALFIADQFAPLLAVLNPAIKVSVIPGVGHLDMTTDPRGTEAVTRLWRQLADGGKAVMRFDFKVREDMFAGMDGDAESFDRAMKTIADTLAAEPDHAQALVWRGDGRLFLAGQAFRRGEIAEGRKLSDDGVADMMRAVKIAPDDLAVRIPRATGLEPFAAGIRPYDRAAADRLTRIALGDFEFALEASTPHWGKLDEHDRGELLGALAESWLQLGDSAKAGPYLDRMIAELPGTPYAVNAALRRADATARKPLTCLGCH